MASQILSFSNHFSTVSSQISGSLLSEKNRLLMDKFSSELPYGISSVMGFESRLGDPEAFLDFMLYFYGSHDGTALLAGKSNISEVGANLTELPQWQSIHRFFEAWVDTDSFLNRSIDGFWFEFDFQRSVLHPEPNVFFNIISENEQDAFINHDYFTRVFDEIYQVMSGSGFPEKIKSNLHKFCKLLPLQASIHQFGIMIPRKTEAIRIILAKTGFHDLKNLLNDMNWEGEMNTVETVMDMFACHFDYSVFSINLGETMLPDLGIEMYYRNQAQPAWESRWKTVFDLLQDKGMALPEKVAGLANFCGKVTSSHWIPVTYYNGINHIKLSCKPGKPVDCKAYFGTMIR